MTTPPRTDRAGGLVYSTDSGRMCPDCRKPVAQCVCRQAPVAVAGDGLARVALEKKGRGGKTVTVIRGLGLAPAALQSLARQLKAGCGSGGTASDGVIEIQGDRVAYVVQALRQRGVGVKGQER